MWGYFRGVHLLKDRFGSPNIFLPMFYLGAAYYFNDLPPISRHPDTKEPEPLNQQRYLKYKDRKFVAKVTRGEST